MSEDNPNDEPNAPDAPATAQGPRRCGFIAIIGAPNAGKSTLVNALVGSKVTIVSHKVQTTRMPIRGIAIEGASQLVFIDTPGIFRPKRRLDRAMVDAAWGSTGADAVAVLIDTYKGLDEDSERILDKLGGVKASRLLVLNKVDRFSWAERDQLLTLTAKLTERVAFDRVFMISALTGDGVADLRSYLAGVVPEGPWHYPEDEISDLPMRILASEITREKIYKGLHDELPYTTTVETTGWTEQKNGSIKIEQTIYVVRDGQKALVLGRGGETVKKISMAAREEIGEIVGKPVHLFLFVKVREGWEADPERYREMGLDFPKD